MSLTGSTERPNGSWAWKKVRRAAPSQERSGGLLLTQTLVVACAGMV
jgi:hypothetical protein